MDNRVARAKLGPQWGANLRTQAQEGWINLQAALVGLILTGIGQALFFSCCRQLVRSINQQRDQLWRLVLVNATLDILAYSQDLTPDTELPPLPHSGWNRSLHYTSEAQEDWVCCHVMVQSPDGKASEGSRCFEKMEGVNGQTTLPTKS